MLEVTNAIVCTTLMVLLAPVAIVMRNDGNWPERLAFTVVAMLLGLQVLSPMFNDWLPDPNGLQIAFNVVVLLVVLSARREIMAVVRLTVGRPPEDTGARRRVEDMPADLMQHVHGRGPQ